MSVSDLPLVSIVTPAYNAAAYLPDLLRSVRSQDYPRVEHVVIDDGSADAGATIRLLERSPAVRWWSRENRGQYATLNEGFRASTGAFVTAISADDLYVDGGAIGALAQCLLAHPDCDVAYGFTLHVDEQGRPLPVQPYQRYPPWMLRYNLGFIFHCSMLVRREALIRDDLLFDDSLRYIGDADWMVRLSLRYRFRRLDRHIGAYRHHGDQVTTMASRDEAGSARRREEHARVHRRYGTSPVLKRLVEVYDTAQQRRVKAVSAWQRGGRREVARTVTAWLRRKSGG
jgi:glycosyltransferase involved in cell wall biosynthesis